MDVLARGGKAFLDRRGNAPTGHRGQQDIRGTAIRDRGYLVAGPTVSGLTVQTPERALAMLGT
jgi:hypothetical protein